jgi:hypothetical protein
MRCVSTRTRASLPLSLSSLDDDHDKIEPPPTASPSAQAVLVELRASEAKRRTLSTQFNALHTSMIRSERGLPPVLPPPTPLAVKSLAAAGGVAAQPLALAWPQDARPAVPTMAEEGFVSPATPGAPQASPMSPCQEQAHTSSGTFGVAHEARYLRAENQRLSRAYMYEAARIVALQEVCVQQMDLNTALLQQTVLPSEASTAGANLAASSSSSSSSSSSLTAPTAQHTEALAATMPVATCVYCFTPSVCVRVCEHRVGCR